MMVAVASVLISAGRRRRVTKSPLTAPIAAPTARHAKTMIGNASLLPRAIPAPRTRLRVRTAPTERSIQPISTTSVWPIATKASGATCWPRRSKRAGSRNEGMSAPAIVKRTIRLTSAGIARLSAGH